MFTCHYENCDKSYKRKDHLKRHITCFHLNLKLFKCNYNKECNLSFNTKYHLNRHIKCVHGPPQYQCNYCSLKFQKKRKLVKHIQLKHNEMCKFICFKCNKRYSRQCDLNRHQRHRHKYLHLNSNSDLINHQKEIIYICNKNKCNKTFKDKFLYKQHLLFEKKKTNKMKRNCIQRKNKTHNLLNEICGKNV